MPKKISQKQPTDQHNGTQSATHKWSRKSCIGLIVVLLSAMVTRFLHLDQPNEIAYVFFVKLSGKLNVVGMKFILVSMPLTT